MVHVWRKWLSDHPDAQHLPVIVPLVLHHSPTGWRAAVAFEDLFALDRAVRAELAPYLVHFRFLLDDLSAQSDEALRARAMTALGRLSLWCLRHARNPNWKQDQLYEWLSVLREVHAAPSGVAALSVVLRYLYAVHGKLNHEKLRAFVAREFGKDVEEAIVTTVDQLREEGFKKGRKEGRKKERRRMLLKLLGARFGRLPEAAVARVKAASFAQLGVWADRVLTAPTLADVLGEE